MLVTEDNHQLYLNNAEGIELHGGKSVLSVVMWAGVLWVTIVWTGMISVSV